MSSAATADRVVADGILPTDMVVRGGNDHLRELLRTRELPVIVADNVAAYVRDSDREYRVGDFPCLAPPFHWAWIEYPSSSFNQRRACYVLGFDLAAEDVETDELRGMVGDAIVAAGKESPGEKARFALVVVVFTDDGEHVGGPLGTIIFILDERGKDLGNRWFLRNKNIGWHHVGAPTDREAASLFLFAASLPALQTIAFMHCKNVVVEHGHRDAPLAKKYRKRTGHDPLAWKTVRLELPRKDGGSGGRTGTGITPDLHIVSGHFAHYGDCCPTTHEPKGKLFGRLEGVYWVPQHLAGDPARPAIADRVVALRPVS